MMSQFLVVLIAEFHCIRKEYKVVTKEESQCEDHNERVEVNMVLRSVLEGYGDSSVLSEYRNLEVHTLQVTFAKEILKKVYLTVID